jgi:hypothetical protein
MTTDTSTAIAPEDDRIVEEMISQLRELFADAPEVGKKALENVLSRLASDADNDTRMLFATAYDGDWDAYIDDFATKIPDFLDIIDSAWAAVPVS